MFFTNKNEWGGGVSKFAKSENNLLSVDTVIPPNTHEFLEKHPSPL